MKKLLAMLLPVVLALGTCIPAFAAEGAYKITLKGAQSGHTYEAYQVFSGDLHEGVLSNIEWGEGIAEEAKAGLGNAAEIAKAIETAEDAEAFAATIAPSLGAASGSVTIAEGQNVGEINGLEAGYYLVKTSATPAQNGVYAYYMMLVVGDTQVDVKAAAPSVEKAVDAGSATIGDTVTFTLTATMPSNIAGYKTYKVVFHDTLSAGLAYEGNLKVLVAGEDKTEAFSVSEAAGELTVACDDVLDLGAAAGTTIVVTYDAVLDFDAAIGGNGNVVRLEYSNNPNWTGEGVPTGWTPGSEVKVFTWSIPVFKYTGESLENAQPLSGAGFTLYAGEAAVKVVSMGEGIYRVCTLAGCEHTHATEMVTGDTGEVTIEGLAEGAYRLEESTTPAGYNTCEDIAVVIGKEGALTQNGDATRVVNVVNNTGTIIPSTGGSGTTILYAIGAILVIGAAALLVSRRAESDR